MFGHGSLSCLNTGRGWSPTAPAYSGVEQLVARMAHNHEVTGSSPVPATIGNTYGTIGVIGQRVHLVWVTTQKLG